MDVPFSKRLSQFGSSLVIQNPLFVKPLQLDFIYWIMILIVTNLKQKPFWKFKVLLYLGRYLKLYMPGGFPLGLIYCNLNYDYSSCCGSFMSVIILSLSKNSVHFMTVFHSYYLSGKQKQCPIHQTSYSHMMIPTQHLID